MSIKRKYSSNKAECKVTFILTQELANNFNTVSVVGDFNNWNIKKTLLLKLNRMDHIRRLLLYPPINLTNSDTWVMVLIGLTKLKQIKK